jgi:hypothetical protein
MACIDHYEFGWIVVDGKERQCDLIILPYRLVAELVAAGRTRIGAPGPG